MAIQLFRDQISELSQDGSGVAFTALPTAVSLPGFGPSAPGLPITHSLRASKDVQSFQQATERVITQAANQSNVSVNFGSVTTATYIRIETDQPITVTSSGSKLSAFPVNPTTMNNGVLECTTSGITTLTITTPSTNAATANIFISLAGV